MIIIEQTKRKQSQFFQSLGQDHRFSNFAANTRKLTQQLRHLSLTKTTCTVNRKLKSKILYGNLFITFIKIQTFLLL